MTTSRGSVIIGTLIIVVGFMVLVTCDGDKGPTLQPKRDTQIQEQLKQEQERRSEAERLAVSAESSRNSWIIGMAGGACGACTIALLLGIHIGSRA